MSVEIRGFGREHEVNPPTKIRFCGGVKVAIPATEYSLKRAELEGLQEPHFTANAAEDMPLPLV